MIPAVEAMLTKAAGPPALRVLRSAGIMTCTEWKTDLRLTSMQRSKSRSVVSSTGLDLYVAPALLMMKFTPPNAFSVAASAASQSARFVTSPAGQWTVTVQVEELARPLALTVDVDGLAASCVDLVRDGLTGLVDLRGVLVTA